MRGFEFFKKDGEKAYKDAKLPAYQTKTAAGADLFCAEDVVIPSIFKSISNIKDYIKAGMSQEDIEKNFKPTLVHTGVCSVMPEDEVLELYNRSSNPKRGLVLANSVGVVDSDYHGEIMLAFYNFLPFDVTVKAGDRVGQGVFKKFLRADTGVSVVDKERGEGGFGSTGA